MDRCVSDGYLLTVGAVQILKCFCIVRKRFGKCTALWSFVLPACGCTRTRAHVVIQEWRRGTLDFHPHEPYVRLLLNIRVIYCLDLLNILHCFTRENYILPSCNFTRNISHFFYILYIFSKS